MTIGDRIKARRKELGISVDQLADRIGKNRATVYRYESGEIDDLPLSVLAPIAEALYCSPAYLLGWDDDDQSYFIDKKAAELADFLHKNPDYSVLFDASRKVSKEDIMKVKAMIDLMSDK